MTRRNGWFAMVSASIVLGACGGGDEEQSPSDRAENAVRAFVAAVDERQAAAACGHLSDEGKAAFADQVIGFSQEFPTGTSDCETAMRSYFDDVGGGEIGLMRDDFEVIDVDLEEDTGTVKTREATWTLEEVGDGWKVTTPLPEIGV